MEKVRRQCTSSVSQLCGAVAPIFWRWIWGADVSGLLPFGLRATDSESWACTVSQQ